MAFSQGKSFSQGNKKILNIANLHALISPNPRCVVA